MFNVYPKKLQHSEQIGQLQQRIKLKDAIIKKLESKLRALSRCVLDIDTTVCVVASNPQLRDAKTMAALNLRDENKHNINENSSHE